MTSAPVDNPAPAGRPYVLTEEARAHALATPPATPNPVTVTIEVTTKGTVGTPQWIYPHENIKAIVQYLVAHDETTIVRPIGGNDPVTGADLTVYDVANAFEAAAIRNATPAPLPFVTEVPRVDDSGEEPLAA